jgi:hypothetical protein
MAFPEWRSQSPFVAPSEAQPLSDGSLKHSDDPTPLRDGKRAPMHGQDRRYRTLLGWRRQNTFIRPTVVTARIEGVAIQANANAPVLYAQRFSLKRDALIRSFVPALGAPICPDAVVRLVAAVIVDALKRVLGWARPHVCDEVIKGEPAIAHGNATSSVVAVIPVRWILATLFHAVPNSIKTSHSADSCRAAQTTTTSRVATDQVAAKNRCDGSAFASTHPGQILAILAPRLDRCESAEGLACQITRIPVEGYNSVSHAGSFLRGTVLVRGWRALMTCVSLAFNYPTKYRAGVLLCSQ